MTSEINPPPFLPERRKRKKERNQRRRGGGRERITEKKEKRGKIRRRRSRRGKKRNIEKTKERQKEGKKERKEKKKVLANIQGHGTGPVYTKTQRTGSMPCSELNWWVTNPRNPYYLKVTIYQNVQIKSNTRHNIADNYMYAVNELD